MADTTHQMNQEIGLAAEMATEQGHTMGAFEGYSGGAVGVAVCQMCDRYAWVEIFPFDKDTRGPALNTKCELLKRKA